MINTLFICILIQVQDISTLHGIARFRTHRVHFRTLFRDPEGFIPGMKRRLPLLRIFFVKRDLLRTFFITFVLFKTGKISIN